MAEMTVALDRKPLSQAERVVDTFVAPSKTFQDLLRSRNWWLPCVLVLVMSAVFSAVAIRKVGIARMSDNTIATMPKIQDMLASAKPDESLAIHQRVEKQISGSFYSTPVLMLVAGFAIAGLFLFTANFAFGGSATYRGMLALFWYSVLPLIVLSALVSILLACGVNVESFRVSNPIGTNPGYYMPDGSSPVTVAILSFFDIFSIWVFCLQALGAAIIARISLGKAFAAVGIWWVLYCILKIVPALLVS